MKRSFTDPIQNNQIYKQNQACVTAIVLVFAKLYQVNHVLYRLREPGVREE